MSKFEDALSFTLRWEGGYINHPSDPGGETHFGISERAYPDEDIAGMTQSRAAEIYKADYWDQIKGDELQPKTGLCAFDLAVHSGVARASRFMQTAVKVPTDGVVGPVTVNALWHKNDEEIAWDILTQRVEFLLSLNKRVFNRGWMKRCMDLARRIA